MYFETETILTQTIINPSKTQTLMYNNRYGSGRGGHFSAFRPVANRANYVIDQSRQEVPLEQTALTDFPAFQTANQVQLAKHYPSGWVTFGCIWLTVNKELTDTTPCVLCGRTYREAVECKGPKAYPYQGSGMNVQRYVEGWQNYDKNVRPVNSFFTNHSWLKNSQTGIADDAQCICCDKKYGEHKRCPCAPQLKM